MRFLADAMLGKTSRWLRLLGYDVVYIKSADDQKLIELARTEGRILLTSDQELFRQAALSGVKVFLVRGSTEHEKLASIACRFKIRLKVIVKKSRCPSCNAPISSISKSLIKDKIPIEVYKSHRRFWACTACGKIYYKGSHWAKINAVLMKAKRILTHNSKTTYVGNMLRK